MSQVARAWTEHVLTQASYPEAQRLRLREPTGFDELAVHGIDTCAATALLSRLVDPSEPVAELAASDRDALLAALHRGLWGDRILSSLQCSACKVMYDLSFELSLLQRQICAEREPVTAIGLRAVEDSNGHRFRLPSATEEERAADLGIDEGRQHLAAICNDAADPQVVDERLEKIAPLLDVDLEAPCAECGHPALARFDIQTFTLQRLVDERQNTLAEVHVLASGYNWSLGEILGLTRSLRRAFAERAGCFAQ